MGAFISWIQTNVPSKSSDGSSTAPQSVWGMIDSLIPILVISAVYIIIFLIMRRSQKRFYAPRSYLGFLRKSERSPELSSGWFAWFGTFWKLPDAYALTHQGLDAYLFLRYLRVAMVICFVSACITWPILFPVNATGGGNQEQLEIISYSNINVQTQGVRFYAHAFVAWFVYGFVMFMILRECIFYINLRQAYLLTPHYAKRMSSRTVLFTSVPNDYLDEKRIRELFNNSIKYVWVVGKTEKMDELVQERDEVAMKLEKAEVNLIKLVNKARTKAAKKGGDDAAAARNGYEDDSESADVVRRYIPVKKRPSHRTGPLGLVGRKVDTIEWSRSELRRLIPEVEKLQSEWDAGKYDRINAVFVEFHNQADAQAAFQVVTHHQGLHMCPKVVGVKPEEVVWSSLEISWWQAILRRYAVYLFIGVLIIFWAIPVAIVGVISQVSVLVNLPGLTWLNSLPQFILGVISGLLPAVALAILMSFVPIIMRACGRLAGHPTLSRIELFTQNAYFVFQVVQVFLIRTVADSFAGVVVQIAENPGQVFTILGSSIPTSSNFYISYFMLQGLTIATGVVTQVVGVFVFKILYKYLTGTPRAMYTKWTTLSSILWGSLLPVYTNIICISLIYSVIAPFILFWSTLAMALFYLAYRYNVLFVSATEVDTQGLIYPRALKQLFVGIYLAEICLVGLFGASKAIGPAVLMAAFLVFTILFNLAMVKYLDPLLYGLPRSVQAQEMAIQAGADGLGRGPESNESSTGNVSDEKGEPKKGNFIARFFKPWIHQDYATLRTMMPQEDAGLLHQYTDEVERTAYFPPSVSSKAPTLWIPRDAAGVSRQEVALTNKVIPISDEGATLDEKNNIVWDTEGARPPIWEEKVYY
ncbi:DUF221 domain-containing protein [Drechmeria coniospora]|uniref:DUF221 domain-containing protein n=1 Tax=Drechmeria coniospora TaxID=98403 RepID=A0A151GWE5_DRECN|nr:DUF221 domain-containing protein [Drechmeria coniospora]KYK61391.1 DUF221 domain-containing protein [Drechmeria coniospora]